MCNKKDKTKSNYHQSSNRHRWSWSLHRWSLNHHHRSSNHHHRNSLCFMGEKSQDSLSSHSLCRFFPGKIRNDEKNAGPCNPAWPVSAHSSKGQVPKRPIPRGPQIYGLRKPCPNTVPRQSFTGQTRGPDPWLLSLSVSFPGPIIK